MTALWPAPARQISPQGFRFVADFAIGETCTVGETAADVTDRDTVDPPDAMAADYSFSFATVTANRCDTAFTPIHDIQGSGTTNTAFSTTVAVPNGWTLNGDGHTITAYDPAGGHFRGAVVANAGAVANVHDVTVTGYHLADVCDAGADALRGILLDGASGVLANNHVVDVRQDASCCQEGNGIEVRNERASSLWNQLTDFRCRSKKDTMRRRASWADGSW